MEELVIEGWLMDMVASVVNAARLPREHPRRAGREVSEC